MCISVVRLRYSLWHVAMSCSSRAAILYMPVPVSRRERGAGAAPFEPTDTALIKCTIHHSLLSHRTTTRRTTADAMRHWPLVSTVEHCCPLILHTIAEHTRYRRIGSDHYRYITPPSPHRRTRTTHRHLALICPSRPSVASWSEVSWYECIQQRLKSIAPPSPPVAG